MVHERGGEGVGVGKVEKEHVDNISFWYIKDILCIEKLERDAAADEDYITETDSESETIETDTDTTETETTETYGMEATDIDHEDS